jgi:predicted amidophosphoribosyltransferase
VAGKHPRMDRESRTVEAMIAIYCRGHHGTRLQLCSECDELLAYARERLNKCPFQEGKTTCAQCPVHCYKPAMRDRIRAVMRYAGPRMLARHPILTLFHFIDGRRKEPVREERNEFSS